MTDPESTPSVTCRICGEALPIEAFGVDRSRPNGRRTACRECSNARDRALYRGETPPPNLRLPHKSPEERFLEKVRKGETPGECWEWNASFDRYGYGHFWLDGRYRGSHRVSYELFVEEIPEGLHIDHLCRNRSCVNPAHLETVTNEENQRRATPFLAAQGLRSERSTHCKHGHEWTPENLYVAPSGNRRCRECHRIGKRRQRARRKLR